MSSRVPDKKETQGVFPITFNTRIKFQVFYFDSHTHAP